MQWNTFQDAAPQSSVAYFIGFFFPNYKGQNCCSRNIFLRLFPRVKLSSAAANQLCIGNAQTLGQWGRRLWASLTPGVLTVISTHSCCLCVLCACPWEVWHELSWTANPRWEGEELMATGGVKAAPFLSFLCELIILKCCTVTAPGILSYLQWFPLERRLTQGNFLSTFLSVFPPSLSTTFELTVALQPNLAKTMRFQ